MIFEILFRDVVFDILTSYFGGRNQPWKTNVQIWRNQNEGEIKDSMMKKSRNKVVLVVTQLVPTLVVPSRISRKMKYLNPFVVTQFKSTGSIISITSVNLTPTAKCLPTMVVKNQTVC